VKGKTNEKHYPAKEEGGCIEVATSTVETVRNRGREKEEEKRTWVYTRSTTREKRDIKEGERLELVKGGVRAELVRRSRKGIKGRFMSEWPSPLRCHNNFKSRV